MKLSDVKVKNLKAVGKHADGKGLYLLVAATGAKYWRLKYRYGGKEKLLALGTYPEVTLAQARDKRTDARRALAEGVDPGELKKQAKALIAFNAENTFKSVSIEWMDHQRSRWSEDTAAAIKASLETHAYPTLGSRPIANLAARDVMAVVKGVESTGARDMAGRVLQRIKAVFRFAVTHDKIKHNPMLDLVQSEILKPYKVKHRAAIALEELPDFLRKLGSYGGDPHTKNAMWFLILTATRSGEARGARWAEIDAKIWRIPAARMKMDRDHVIPLSRQALEVLDAMKPLTGDRELIFPSPYYPSKSLSENTFNSMLARMGFGEATVHGFRSLFSTIANEAGHNADAIERALAHAERNEVRAAYDRGIRLQERQKLMQWWADYLDGLRHAV
ncbi:tyrosine-type recombinase/integrase [Xenophilus azovorans]|uniref:tyrosine-type recombinase/integrase n=1 Tax=Xenophilus azovorans TaxID=151755 RepID=UPI00056F8B6E|nr:integrase arm-type DNA-binding domain-containing protein [Xenophilus azovorans]